MHKFVSFNSRIFAAAEANLGAISSAALYGRGIFTTLAINDKIPFLWAKHWRRLNAHAAKIGIDLSGFAEDFVKNRLSEIIEENEIERARARITLFDESPHKIWSSGAENKVSLLIQTADLRETGGIFSLNVSPFRINSTSPLAGVKSCNYLENVLALEEAKSKRFDEAIRLNERGEIVSACMANIFWRNGEEFFTPSLKTGCLDGTTREYFMEKHTVVEVEESVEALKTADEILLTSAGIGIVKAQAANFRSGILQR